MPIRSRHGSFALTVACAALCGIVLAPAVSAQSLGPAPSWVLSIEPGTWAAVGKNSISDVDPADDPQANPNYPGTPPWNGKSGQSAVVTAWNGGAFATGYGSKGSMIVWGGGHQDYYGNEIYAFDMATQTWSRVTDPYAGSMNFPFQDGYFPDNTPVPPHIYDQIEYHPGTNSLVVLRTMASNTPNNVPVAALFSFDTMKWRRGARNSKQHHVSGGWSAYDSSRDVFWAEGGSGTDALASFNPKTDNGNGTWGTWSNNSPKIEVTDAVGARDPKNDILVVTAYRYSSDVWAIDLKNLGNAAVKLNQAGSGPNGQPGNGWEWSQGREAFLYWSGGSAVYEFKQTGSDWRSGPWTWTRLTGSNNSVTPNNSASGAPYSRFRVVRYDDAEVAVLVTSVTGPVYVFRVPGAGQLIRPKAPTGVDVE